MARLFIVTDTLQGPLIDAVADALAAQGHAIVRGPINASGVIKTYSAREQAMLFADVDVAIFTTRHLCSRATMEAATRLRGVAFPVTGVETLDLAAADELGIIVGHGAVRGNVIGMAESTIMLILMLLYDVETNIARLAAGQWRRPGHSSRSLDGKTIGLLGFGRIAREMASRLLPFGVTILTTSPRAKQSDLPEGVTKVDLPDLLAQSDVLCVLTGLTPETQGMIGAAELARMKSSAHLVNTSRGGVIDEAALHAHLAAHRIAGAALDTFAVEPLPAESPLRTLDNVILTPHCVGHTIEGTAEFAPTMIANVNAILAGELPPICKNPLAEPAWRQRLARLDESTSS